MQDSLFNIDMYILQARGGPPTGGGAAYPLLKVPLEYTSQKSIYFPWNVALLLESKSTLDKWVCC